jgi:ribosome-associated toxin RatA of RatAB toxin-antitoxin module
MKEFRGQATETVAASAEECFALLAAIDRYPLWYPDVVREVEVLGRDAQGHPSVVRAKFRLAYKRLVHDFDLVLAVSLDEPQSVKLARVGGSQHFDLTWHVRANARTQIELELYARVRVPGFVPLDGVGSTIAEQMVAGAKTALASGS